MKLHHLVLSALLAFTFTTAQADKPNQPDMLTALSGEHMELMNTTEKTDTKGEYFSYAGDRTTFCRYRPGGCISTWKEVNWSTGRYVYGASYYSNGRYRVRAH